MPAKQVLRVKTVVFRNLFYWSGKILFELVGRELIYAKEKLLTEEEVRLSEATYIKCPKCGSFVPESELK